MGAINTREFADPRAEPAVLKPLTDASHGSDRWLINGLPDIRMIEKPTRVAARDAAGSGWIGLYRQHDYVRSEERRVGKECVSTRRSRWTLEHEKNKHILQ